MSRAGNKNRHRRNYGASAGNQLPRHRKHRQSITQAAQPQATRYKGGASTGNQIPRQRKHRQTITQAAPPQATSYPTSASKGIQLPKEHKQRQPVTEAVQSPKNGFCELNWRHRCPQKRPGTHLPPARHTQGNEVIYNPTISTKLPKQRKQRHAVT